MKVVHIIPDLNQGGAEFALIRLAAAFAASEDPVPVKHTVICLKSAGRLAPQAEAAGLTVHALDMGAGELSIAGIRTLRRQLRELSPDVVHTWMYHANLLGALTRPRGIPLLWSIRHAEFIPEQHSRTTRLVFDLTAWISRFAPDAISFASYASAIFHFGRGYPPRKSVVIPNGIDGARFRPDENARLVVRGELGVPARVPMIGLVGRFTPEKDHATFFRAAELVREQVPDLQVVLCGEDATDTNRELMDLIPGALRGCVHLLGVRLDAAAVMNALDVLVLSSSSESFPNVVVEAMACGVPVVSTDVGDARRIIDAHGEVVPIGQPDQIAIAVVRALLLERSERERIGQRSRQHVLDTYDLDRFVAAYRRLYLELAQRDRQ